MGRGMPRELRTWGDEFSALVRRWWWVALIVFLLSWLPPVPPVQVTSAIGTLVLVAIVVIWFTTTVGRMPRTTGDKWKRQTARSILTSWGTVAARLGLSVQDYVTRGNRSVDQRSRLGPVDLRDPRRVTSGARTPAPTGAGRHARSGLWRASSNRRGRPHQLARSPTRVRGCARATVLSRDPDALGRSDGDDGHDRERCVVGATPRAARSRRRVFRQWQRIARVGSAPWAC